MSNRLVSQEAIADRIAAIHTTSEEEMPGDIFRQMVLDGLRFQGAATLCCEQLTTSREINQVASQATKSWADDFLVAKYAKYGVSLYYAHSAMNVITHRNLPPVIPGTMDDFVNEPFYTTFLALTGKAVEA